jgi:hypothetical protein
MTPEERYQFLVDTAHSLEVDTRVRSYGWFIVHNKFLQDIYDRFEDFERVHPELDSDFFRGSCIILNNLLHKLLMEFKDRQWFGLYDYLEFCKVLLAVINYCNEGDDLDDLADMFQGLGGETD